ncbi:MAG TPA: hypothetical protein VMT57_05575 [Candidatus Thermoplasmatota archaeon]|nr:hypothetical protein [Candidatus Thermoplasmatota archaeon]
MMIILKRQDQTSICCPNRTRKRSSASEATRVKLYIAVGLLLIGVWIMLAFH